MHNALLGYLEKGQQRSFVSQKITVFDNYFKVEFKAGLKIEIEK